MAKLGAGVRKTSTGTLEKRFTVNGKRYSVYGKTQKELTEKELQRRKEIAAGIYTANRNITLDKYFTELINSKRRLVKGNTLRVYISIYNNHIKPAMGSKKIKLIERREVQLLQNSIADELSISTANMAVRIIKIILNEAVNDDIIAKNPANGVKAIKDNNKATETYHRALSNEEQAAFMQEIKNDFYYEFIALLISTGMRSGEAAALTWNDIDYKNNVIHITNTMTYTETGELVAGDTPKTSAGKRDIPLTDTIKHILAMQRSKMGNIISMNNKNVFMSVYGGYVYNRAINAAITEALKRLEAKGTHIDHFTAHALRDTFATRYIEQGGKPQTLKVILGHSSFSMTMDLYAHVLPNTKQQEMDRINIAI